MHECDSARVFFLLIEEKIIIILTFIKLTLIAARANQRIAVYTEHK